jgi:glucosamine--fructose-6-phosphate aminotransferase (isomerizing)
MSDYTLNRANHTISEIMAQPRVWQTNLDFLAGIDIDTLAGDRLPHTHEWVFIGCGTSYYLAQAAAYSSAQLTGKSARAVPASEILLFPESAFRDLKAKVFPVLISRSGHTTEVLQVAEWLNENNIQFMAITCDGNELAQTTKRTLRLPVVERSTVMTSSFTSMLIALQYLAASIAGDKMFLTELAVLPAHLEVLLGQYAPEIEKFAQRSFENVSILGQGPFFGIACETALKVMESSSTYAQYFHTLEFRHGPKSVVSEKTLVGALISESGQETETPVLQEMKALGSLTFAVVNRATPSLRSSTDLTVELNLPVSELAQLSVFVVWGQLIGSYHGMAKGLDPDSPQNLDRVVTIPPFVSNKLHV